MTRLPLRWQHMLDMLMADPPASYAEISEPTVRRHAIVALHGARQPNAPIQPAMARPISSGESS